MRLSFADYCTRVHVSTRTGRRLTAIGPAKRTKQTKETQTHLQARDFGILFTDLSLLSLIFSRKNDLLLLLQLRLLLQAVLLAAQLCLKLPDHLIRCRVPSSLSC